MTQQSLFGEAVPVAPRAEFDGKSYEGALDYARLNRQLRLVLDVMKDGQWRTLRRIAEVTREPEASISARLRDLRKERFGAWTVERVRITQGTFSYRVTK